MKEKIVIKDNLYRVYMKNIKDINYLSSEQKHHLINVLRLKNGDFISIFNQIDGEFYAEIKFKGRNEYIVEKIYQLEKSPDKKNNKAYLCFSLLKLSNNSLVIEKATELGIDGLFPIISDKCIVRTINIEKINRIAIGATEQSNRLTIPNIYDVQTIHQNLDILINNKNNNIYNNIKSENNILNNNIKSENNIESCFNNKNTIIIFEIPSKIKLYQEINQKFLIKPLLEWIIEESSLKNRIKKIISNYFVYIGPEGGWSDKDRQTFIDYALISNNLSDNKTEFIVITVSENIMRAETACIAAASWICSLTKYLNS
ncbi:16S rRNA (uracil(1498)-N(3))-methyltransferase [Lyticum sinuosum]|uniref:Ribosomal RNA small subunit methyltransferase E n=1 Tax=Lyticum sinuosum TaxID=1332059 RepID=A0AAE5AHF3_9RICK|nr:RsmE family RNA methyltransferase [Lyticum sinuosum]MDZ5761505.1 Ribosomal RNA small subunit methyltransferase E [Lyticum sinuosum]